MKQNVATTSLLGASLLLHLCLIDPAKAGEPEPPPGTPGAGAMAGLMEIEKQFQTLYDQQIRPKHEAGLAALDAQYLSALERAMSQASEGGRLEEAVAIRDEIRRVKDKRRLRGKDEAPLTKLRGTYRQQLVQLTVERSRAAAPLLEQFANALAKLQGDLTRAARLDEALVVKRYREGNLAGRLTGDVSFPMLAVAGTGALSRPPVAATREKPYENSLGMRFVPVSGTDVLFCLHETRWKDYAEYARMTPGIDGSWRNQTHEGVVLTERPEEHPVVFVSWEDANGFCRWLTEKENRAYRLPTDREWSLAAGLSGKEPWTPDDTPETVMKVPDEYPWGKTWPPPNGAGNYGDECLRTVCQNPNQGSIEGYNDGFPTTSPVMRFSPNEFGIFDLGGNVWEFCEDWYDVGKIQRVYRGGSWVNGQAQMLTSFRAHSRTGSRAHFTGFRIVVATAGGVRDVENGEQSKVVESRPGGSLRVLIEDSHGQCSANSALNAHFCLSGAAGRFAELGHTVDSASDLVKRNRRPLVIEDLREYDLVLMVMRYYNVKATFSEQEARMFEDYVRGGGWLLVAASRSSGAGETPISAYYAPVIGKFGAAFELNFSGRDSVRLKHGSPLARDGLRTVDTNPGVTASVSFERGIKPEILGEVDNTPVMATLTAGKGRLIVLGIGWALVNSYLAPLPAPDGALRPVSENNMRLLTNLVRWRLESR